jgi:hypothetical protein
MSSGRRESVGRLSAQTQSSKGPPVQQMVSVAVLPPRLNTGFAPPTGIGGSEAMSWDESLNWQHNERIKKGGEEAPDGRRKSFMRKAGLTTQRQKVNPDTPPFVLRQIPYDTWRKHYAKDKNGNYKGTHTPAEDCLLKPDDVQKWRLGEPVTKADLWTRGKEALPVYAEVGGTQAAPVYEHDYDGPPRTPHPEENEGDGYLSRPAPSYPNLQDGEDYLEPEDDRLISHLDRRNGSVRNYSSDHQPAVVRQHSYISSRTDSIQEETEPRGQTIANGKTAKEIIAEAEAKGKPKVTLKQMLSKGVQMASFGG